jgi:hypothetical protein
MRFDHAARYPTERMFKTYTRLHLLNLVVQFTVRLDVQQTGKVDISSSVVRTIQHG